MAWRIDRAVVRGEIDNTLRGVTTGRIWLAGREEPLRLTLEGDCWRDLAGTKLLFANPHPKEDLGETEALQIEQTGVIGDMTASRRMRVASVESEKNLPKEDLEKDEPPYSWRNALSLEWFSEANGRVLLEAVDFTLELADYEWSLDADEEQAQKMANLQSMRDFMAVMIRRRERSGGDSDKEADEFEWEERLKESDRLADAYQEVLEKYMDDPDAEQKEAFVMGWDGLLEAMAAQHEGATEDDEEGGEPAPFDLSAFEGDDDFLPNEDGAHPLQQSAQELALRTMELLPRGEEEGDSGGRLAANLVQISAKLAGALNHQDEETGPESGYVLAILKRCMNWLNEAVADCQHLMDTEPDSARRKSLDNIRRELFSIRDGVVALRREWKQH